MKTILFFVTSLFTISNVKAINNQDNPCSNPFFSEISVITSYKPDGPNYARETLTLCSDISTALPQVETLDDTDHLGCLFLSTGTVLLDDTIQENRIGFTHKRGCIALNMLTTNRKNSYKSNRWYPSLFVEKEQNNDSGRWIWYQVQANKPEMNSIIIDVTNYFHHSKEEFYVRLRVAWPPKQRRSLSLVALVFSPSIFSKTGITTSIAVSYR